MPDRHGWNSWYNYKSAHEGYMKHYSFFIIEDDFKFYETEDIIYGHGTIKCKNGIVIIINKELEVAKKQNRISVRTIRYSYHVMCRHDNEVTNLFRYDNLHTQENHPDEHHLHEFYPDGTERIIHVGSDNWPTLGKVIEKALEISNSEI